MGLGKMGLGMAGRLLAAGHELRVYNRTPSKAAAGFQLFDSPAEAAAGADAVIVCRKRDRQISGHAFHVRAGLFDGMCGPWACWIPARLF